MPKPSAKCWRDEDSTQRNDKSIEEDWKNLPKSFRKDPTHWKGYCSAGYSITQTIDELWRAREYLMELEMKNTAKLLWEERKKRRERRGYVKGTKKKSERKSDQDRMEHIRERLTEGLAVADGGHDRKNGKKKYAEADYKLKTPSLQPSETQKTDEKKLLEQKNGSSNAKQISKEKPRTKTTTSSDESDKSQRKLQKHSRDKPKAERSEKEQKVQNYDQKAMEEPLRKNGESMGKSMKSSKVRRKGGERERRHRKLVSVSSTEEEEVLKYLEEREKHRKKHRRKQERHEKKNEQKEEHHKASRKDAKREKNDSDSEHTESQSEKEIKKEKMSKSSRHGHVVAEAKNLEHHHRRRHHSQRRHEKPKERKGNEPKNVK